MSKAAAEASDTGIGADVSQQQSRATNSLTTFHDAEEIRMKPCMLSEAMESGANSQLP